MLAAVWGLSSGCYVLQPVVGNPLPLGTEIGIDVNDAGRLALGGAMGPEIAQIEGRLVDKDSSGYVVAVSMVHLLRGGEQVWNAERVRIKAEHVSGVHERKLSKGRTAVMVAASVGVVALIVRQSIVGSLFGSEGKLPPDSAQTVRIPHF
jgi:hypothetical protein